MGVVFSPLVLPEADLPMPVFTARGGREVELDDSMCAELGCRLDGGEGEGAER